jgi:signal transduction histidine kinase
MEKELHLKVKDTGRGIELKDKSVLFTRFFKQDPAIQGTGLGLVICKEIAEIYGGAIEVASAGEGKGTAVTVKLPRTLLSR